VGPIDRLEGSPIDRLLFLGLIVAGFVVLKKRKVTLLTVFRSNPWLIIFLIWGLLSVMWSDYPFVSFKRWIKVLGHPVMALIILTEPNVEEAINKMMKRCAYIILPVSILFVKYLPHLGRGYDQWTGQVFNVGVTLDKNALGYDCMILGLFFIWRLMVLLPQNKSKSRRDEILHHLGFLAMVLWLFSMADSKTPLLSMCFGVIIMVVLGFRFVDKRHFGALVVVAALSFFMLNWGFGIYEATLKFIGRNPTLTDRTIIWAEALKTEINPLLGAGFESFWDGPRMDYMVSVFHFKPNQAHNGYLETYLNTGWIGLILLVVLLLVAFSRIRKSLFRNFSFGRFRMGLFFGIVMYNFTEATFMALHLVWFVFYLAAMVPGNREALQEDMKPVLAI